MEAQMQSISDWLEAHMDRTVSIRKEEQGDSDEVRLQLARSGYKEPKSDDDYVDDPSLLLYGSGIVIAGDRTLPLPQDVFVIPVAGLSSVVAAGDSLVLQTERATYRINVMQ